jgi:hypothetical protein
MDIIEIRDKYNNKGYSYEVKIPKRLAEDYIFDENLTVKCNREMVVEHNQKVKDMYEKAVHKQNELYQQLTEDVVNYIHTNYNMNISQARKVESYIYEHYHSCMYDYFLYIDTVAEFVEKVVDLGRDNS